MTSVDPSNAGPFNIGIDQDLAPGDTIRLATDQIAYGPAMKKGYLKKFYGLKDGFDYVFVQNGSGERVTVTGSGNIAFDVQAATSNNADGPIRDISITNPSANTIAAADIDVAVGNVARMEEGSPEFSVSQLVRDSIPGFR